jgi:glutamyl-tRNA synthetase
VSWITDLCVVELTSTQAPHFLNVATQLRGTLAFPDLVANLDQLDDHLAFRTFLAGHELSSVDLAVWGACKGEPIHIQHEADH